MTDKSPHLDSLFLAALDIESEAEREAFLASACGANAELRQQVEQLLRSHQQAGSFLEQPPPEFAATIVPEAANNARGDALEAGFAASFSEGQAVVLGHAGHSVLKSLRQTVHVPGVVLRNSPEHGADPVVRPKSAEIPDSGSDSRYQLQGEIARGGMGAILKGRDTDLGRDLAIKVLLDTHKDKPEVIQRFIEEAQIGGQLQHPGIAPVYELGQFADRRPFFSMKLVKGETLSKLLADRRNPADERGKFLGIFQQICQTMAYAHNRGVIHRDLKPANIMAGAFGEVQVMDWGLAKVLASGGIADESASQRQQQGQSIIQTLRTGVGSGPPGTLVGVGSHTEMGSVMGTPAYMPPEQALGEIDHLDERADVFGLGAILCEILTGKPPYVGDDGTQVFRMASRGQLGDCFQRLDACGADADLIVLARHCLELEPQDRPRNASVVAERMASYLQSVESRLRETELAKVDAQVRAEELRRRQKLALSAGTAIVASLVIGIAVSAWQARRADLAAKQAQSQQQRASAALEELRATAPAFAEQARALVAKERFGEAIEKLDYAMKLRPDAAEYLVAKGDVLQCQLKLAEAAAIYREAMHVQPGHARAEASAALCDELLSAKPNADGKLTRESLAKLHLAMQRQQRPAAELMPVARLLGEEKSLLVAYWLERLKDLPVSAEQPLAKRLSVREDGRLALNLSDTKVLDLSPLAGAPLAELNVSSTKETSELADLTPLRGLELVELNISNTSVTDLSPLREMRTLERLALAQSKVTDLTELSGLRLKRLSFQGCPVTDLTPIQKMQLEELDLRETRVTDIAPLIGMPIKSIDLSLTPIVDFSPLAKLPLEKCYLQRNRITDLSIFRGMPLKELVLWGCVDARNYAVLSEIKTLELLLLPSEYRALPAQDYDAIGALRSHPKLRQLAAEIMSKMSYANTSPKDVFWRDWDREQTFIPALRKTGFGFSFSKLLDGSYALLMDKQPLSDLSVLKGAPISHLQIPGCKVSDLSPLRGMSLRFLHIGGNPITDLSPLREVTVNELWLSAVPITDLSPLQGSKVERLILHSSQVSDLSPLAGMPLKRLDLHNCRNITDVAPLLKIPTLEELTVPRGARNIGLLRKMPNLKRLSYEVNNTAYDGRPNFQVNKSFRDFFEEFDRHPWIGRLHDAGFAPKRLKQMEDGTWDVSLEGTKLSDATILKGASISRLDLSETEVVDFSPIAELPLICLHIRNPKVTDLSFLRDTKLGASLRELDISLSKVTDFTPLAACTNLNILRAYGTSLSDLSVVKSKYLTQLWIAHTPVTDVTPLAGLPLKAVYLDGCRQLTDISPLVQCPTLEMIILPESATNLTALRELPKLKAMSYTYRAATFPSAAEFWKEYDANPWIAKLRDGGITPKALKQLPDGSWEVDVGGTMLTDLSILKGAPISVLRLGDTPVVDLEPLRGMKIRKLYLQLTKVADLSPLERMPLQELNVSLTKVTDISPLRGMPLTKLQLYGCVGLNDISPLEGCQELRNLSLPPNPKDIEFLRTLPRLERLSHLEDRKNSYRPDKTVAEFWQRHDAKKEK